MSLQQVLAALHDLESAGVVERYAIGGAVGATRYVEAAATEDVDVFVTFKGASRSTLDPLAPIYSHLKSRGCSLPNTSPQSPCSWGAPRTSYGSS